VVSGQEDVAMLVLTRKVGETIEIPERGIRVEVLRIQGSRVRIGITAGLGDRILRGELMRAPEGDEPERKVA